MAKTKNVKSTEPKDKLFSYKVKDEKGKVIKGKMEDISKAAVEKRLQKQYKTVLSISQEVDLGFLTEKKIKKTDLVGLFDNLAFLIGAGITLSEALEITTNNMEHPGLKKACRDITKKVNSGLSFSKALEQNEKVPKGTYIYQLKSGEASGNLENTLVKLSEQIQRDGNFKSEVIGALTYPCMMIVAMFGVVIFMSTTLVPTLSAVFDDMGAELPEITLAVMAFSNALLNHKFLIIGLAIAIPGIPIILYKKTKLRRQMDYLFVKLPLVKFFIREMTYITFAGNMAMLLDTGIMVVESIEITIDTVGNQAMKDAVKQVSDIVYNKGKSLGVAMGETGEFPDKLVRLAEVGSRSGRLAEILDKTSVQMEKEFKVKVKALTKALEPVIMVMITIVLGVIMMAMYLPMFSLLDQI